MKSELILFQLSVVSGMIAWGAVSKGYIWPKIKDLDLAEAVKPLLYIHLFRYIGLMFMIQGVVSKDLPIEFGLQAGWGDLIAAGLAGLSLIALNTKLLKPSLWIFNIVGFVDLLHGFYEARIVLGINPADFASAFYLPVLYVPLLLWTHIMIFLLLIKKK